MTLYLFIVKINNACELRMGAFDKDGGFDVFHLEEFEVEKQTPTPTCSFPTIYFLIHKKLNRVWDMIKKPIRFLLNEKENYFNTPTKL